MDKGLEISIVMPAYNEADHIIPSIHETAKTFNGFGWDYEIIAVDDGSSDATYEHLKEVARENKRIIPVHLPKNVGKGNALRKGFEASRKGELVIFLDCDLDLHPKQADTLVQIMKRTGADIVIGAKRHPRSVVEYPWHRRIISSIYFFVVQILFGMPLRDTQTGLKLFRREVLDKVLPKLLVKRWAFDLELLALAHYYEYRIAHAPVTIQSQRDRSRIPMTAMIHMFLDTVAVFYRLRITHWYQRQDSIAQK